MAQESLIIEKDILDEARDNFLTYSSEVLTDRALRSAEDGLLSSQRKILWTMAEYLKMDSKSKTKKCQSIVGATLLTSYIHGDMSCYGVLRKMSQDFLMRYPLVIPQGSLGTQEDNDMFSSSRYTEAKPSIFADLMMMDYNKNVVPKKETYTGEFMEPVVLPALFPNALCNGHETIAIGMGYNSPPHNLTEVCNAAIAFIEKGDLTLDELLTYIKGPDFPLGGKIINSKDIREAFRTGRSKVSLKIQGDYEVDGQDIIFTTIPYRTYRNKIKEQIAKNIDKFDELLSDYDDESGLGKNRLVFHVKPGISISKALNALFTLTELQTTLSYNMNFIINGSPKICSMLQLLKAYVDHQETCLIKATEYDKAKAEARVHILEGLIAAVDRIDEVIALIKKSAKRAEARAALMDFLSVDEIQANAILDMKLGKLTRIDKEELVNELEERKEFILNCINILEDKEIRNRALIGKITWLRDKYGDERRTQLLNIEIPKKEKEVIVQEPKDCVVTITNKFMVKRVDPKTFRPQKRNTVGTKVSGSELTIFTQKTNTKDALMVFTTKGKMYRVVVDNIHEGINTPLSGLIEFENGELPVAFTTLNRDTDNKFIFFATKNGIVKKVPLAEYDKMKRTGIIAINFKDGDSLVSAFFMNQEQIMLVTKNGMTIRFKGSDLPVSSRIAQGVKGMSLNDGDEVIAALPISSNSKYLVVIGENMCGKRVKLDEFTIQGRGGKGLTLGKNSVAGAVAADTDDEVILINGDKSSLAVAVKEIPILSRTSVGNVMIKNNEKVISIAKV